MSSRFFMAALPPTHLAQQIQRLWNDLVRRPFRPLVEPHITIKAQPGLNPRGEQLLQIKDILEKTPPFKISLGEIGYFPRGIVYFSVRSQELENLHQQMIKLLNPDPECQAPYFEGDHFIPHLSLAKLIKEDALLRKTLEQEAADYFGCYSSFTIDRVRIYERQEGSKLYLPYATFCLARP